MQYGHHVETDSLVSRRMRLVYVVTPKVACTSIKWAISRTDGAFTGRFSAHSQPTAEQAIHSPMVHGLPSLAELSGRRRAEALESDDWVRFCVTRSPYERLLSGWVNKVLLHHKNGSDEELASLTDIGAAFRDFVERLAQGHPLMENAHLAPQARLLEIGKFPYTDVLDIGALDAFLEKLRAGDASRAGLVLGVRANEGLEVRADDLYDTRTAALVEKMFAEDFESLGYERRSFAEVAPEVPVTENERRLMRMARNRELRVMEFSRTLRSSAVVGVVAQLIARHTRLVATGARRRSRRAAG